MTAKSVLDIAAMLAAQKAKLEAKQNATPTPPAPSSPAPGKPKAVGTPPPSSAYLPDSGSSPAPRPPPPAPAPAPPPSPMEVDKASSQGPDWGARTGESSDSPHDDSAPPLPSRQETAEDLAASASDRGASVKRLREEEAAHDSPGEMSEEPDVFASTSPVRKGTAHLQGRDQPSYTDRSKILPETTTSNKFCRPHDIRACRKVDLFKKLNMISEGTYGKVWRAYDTTAKRVMALKQVKMEKEKEGFPLTALREIDVLMNLSHDNIVDVKEIVVGELMDSVFLVMEYLEHDLKFLMEGKSTTWTVSEVKCLLKQLLQAVSFMHENWVMHRDLKTSNLLYSNKGVLKVCDFGLARLVGQGTILTPGTCTLMYRAPEVLLGAKDYTMASDMWSVGIIFAEIIQCRPFITGDDDLDQTNRIFAMMGVPDESTWPGFKDLPLVKKGTKFKGSPISKLHTYFTTKEGGEEEEKREEERKEGSKGRSTSPAPRKDDTKKKAYVTPAGLSLLEAFLTYDPSRRMTAANALKHDFLTTEDPPPKDSSMMPTFPATNEKPRKKARAELRERLKQQAAAASAAGQK